VPSSFYVLSESHPMHQTEEVEPLFEHVSGLVRMRGATVTRHCQLTVGGADQAAACLAWPAIYARTWVYWWRLVVLLLLLAMIEALQLLGNVTG
jgi:hypothetical protein